MDLTHLRVKSQLKNNIMYHVYFSMSLASTSMQPPFVRYYYTFNIFFAIICKGSVVIPVFHSSGQFQCSSPAKGYTLSCNTVKYCLKYIVLLSCDFTLFQSSEWTRPSINF